MLCQGSFATLGEAKQFHKILGEKAHAGLHRAASSWAAEMRLQPCGLLRCLKYWLDILQFK
ncbi:hypothetical protein BLA50215_08008 [Burkholderia lata]|nr:hypothetical protein BLA50215_08008 [Burkholderia lata]